MLYMGVAFIGATPSFVRLSCPILIPSSYPTVGSNIISAWGTTNLTADTHSVAVIFKVPARGNTPDTITLFGVYVRTVTPTPGTDSSIACTLYNVNAGMPEIAAGVPGKPYHPAGSGGPHGGSVITYSSNTMNYISFGTAAICTAGQTIAAVFRRAAGGGATTTVYRTFTSASATTQLFPYSATRLGATSWTRQAVIPAFGLKYSDYATRSSYLDAGMPVNWISTIYIDNTAGSNTDEYGNRMLFPFPMKVIGAWAALTIANAPYKFEIRLYDTTGTNGTLLAAATFGDTINGTSGSEFATKYLYFGGEVTMNANQTYRLVIAPQDTAQYQLYYYSFIDSTSKIYGNRITYTARWVDAAAWNDSSLSVVPHLGLIVSQLSAGQEGGVTGRRRRILGSELDTVFLGMVEAGQLR